MRKSVVVLVAAVAAFVLPGVAQAAPLAPAAPTAEVPFKIGVPAVTDSSCDQATPLCVKPLDRGQSSMSAQALRTLPAWCHEHAYDGWWASRTTSCRISAWRVLVTRPVNGVPRVVGSFDYNQFDLLQTDTNRTTWAQQVQIGIYAAWGDVAGLFVTGGAACSGACTVTSTTFPSQAVAPGYAPGGEATFRSEPAPGTQTRAISSLNYRFGKPGFTPSAPTVVTAPEVRCDRVEAGAGCVVAGLPPTVALSLSGPHSEVAAHVLGAQRTGIPGSPLTRSPLHRLTDTVLQDRNQAVACPANLPKPTGKACDAYPPSSTWEGAVTGRNNFSRKLVDERQEAAVTALLKSFSRDMRVLEGDAFYMLITY
ncbi:hypothetical protein GCM10022243_34740 [Saccharothrix violaceirubra]|uniref:Uncharacterized protein n=1 Tax=Saccharothrix violaceirubra TaxID=413306 RepID=A0A7W7WWW9_9PSEU|nr:hypothetical protein [Saccharothrix violaceirubra]MBB4966526.1 hypothetical protein [Saccharothrix violaceirubra]